MLTVYLACFLIGGVLIATSVLLGGHSHADGHDVEHDIDHDVGHDVEHEIDHGHDADHGSDTDPHASGPWLPFLSVRFWTFFCAFFGLTGLALTWLDLAPGLITLATAVAVGGVSGTGVSWLYRLLKSTQVDSSITNQDLQGGMGRVLLPVEKASPGSVRVSVKGYVKDLRAVTDDPRPIAMGEQVLVVSVRAGVAKVTATGARAIDDELGNEALVAHAAAVQRDKQSQ